MTITVSDDNDNGDNDNGANDNGDNGGDNGVRYRFRPLSFFARCGVVECRNLTINIPGIDWVYMGKALLNIKVDPELKGRAQAVAEALGLPLGTVINRYLREFVHEKRVVFAMAPVPNKKTTALLKKLVRDAKLGKNADGPFNYDEAVTHLDRP